MTKTVFRGRILHCLDNPELRADAVEYLPDGVLVVEDDRILDLLPAVKAFAQGLPKEGLVNLGDKLIVPGFIDTHVHAPQLNVIASYGEQLLEWLEQYTFPAESRFADVEYARSQMEVFIRELLRQGTTTALVFSTSHEHATDALFSAAEAMNMCLIAGKVLMDRNAPEQLVDTAESGFAASQALIERWHGRDRLSYAVTPRFSITSTPEQLKSAGRLMQDFPGLYMQTHLAENHDEVQMVKQLFPEQSNYLDTYDTHGLCTEKSVFAHCLHLEPAEVSRLSEVGATVAFCPSSNLFLGSGLFNWASLDEQGVEVSIASDVGAGTDLSMLKTLADAYKVCQLGGYRLSPMKSFYSITLGNARCLDLDHKVGNLVPGTDADFLVLDMHRHAQVARRVGETNDINDEWFACMMMGDDRLIDEVWVAGQRVC